MQIIILYNSTAPKVSSSGNEINTVTKEIMAEKIETLLSACKNFVILEKVVVMQISQTKIPIIQKPNTVITESYVILKSRQKIFSRKRKRGIIEQCIDLENEMDKFCNRTSEPAVCNSIHMTDFLLGYVKITVSINWTLK
jgi:hypothetical protein